MTSPRQGGRRPIVGIVGAGQLARMTLPAAIPLDVEIRLLAERADDSAATMAKHVDIGSPSNLDDLRRFAAACDILTFDHELVDAVALLRLSDDGHVVRPSPDIVGLVQDKQRQREAMARLGLPIPAFAILRDAESITEFAAQHGWPVIVKAIRGGYDGRGVWVIDDIDGAVVLFTEIGATTPLLVEAWVPIEREVALIIARRPNGETATFPLVETVQNDGICRELRVPAEVDATIAAEAKRIATVIAADIALEGLLAVELFIAGGKVIVNELAARPHNSGHFSIEGCGTSQFAQHLRAVLDWPLGDTGLMAPVVMTVNLLGGNPAVDPRDRLPLALTLPRCYPQLYGKEHRPGRKLGHVTALGEDRDETLARARRCAAILLGDED